MNFPTIKVTDKKGENEIWAKSRSTLELVYSKYMKNFDWFFKADDDTYVIMDNLRRFLYNKDATKLEWYGKVMTNGFNRGHYPQGGAGYAFGSAALKQLVEVGFKSGPNCPNTSLRTHGDDIYLGLCLKESGITLVKDCFDSQGRELFHPLDIEGEFFLRWDKSSDLYKYALNKLATEKCCSKESISFHYVRGRRQFFTDYLMRRLSRRD
ncbi:glycoprotein-N-acetylgalactosamine 3-beta-galactosyltransferase 1-like [Convolutriloba macropyga]|uniref:glycoprotein-N-acetylgalactosamine 3-beta-galactosyltransferase 1-like n=1 Tax=Convolutriloba macropyga TaxID=536237 RepID=UPI003F51BE53